jgi:polysaccharide biosynthesis protein VpsQ
MALMIFWLNTNTMPSIVSAMYDFPLGDKIGHFVVYGTLAYLLTWAMPFRRVSFGRFSLPLGVLIAIVIATLEELSQVFVIRRNADIYDLLASYLGIYASTWIPCMRDACEYPTRKGSP